jgi:hypothetical protein
MAEEFLPSPYRERLIRWYGSSVTYAIKDDEWLLLQFFERDCGRSLGRFFSEWPGMAQDLQDNLPVMVFLGKHAVSDHG